MLYTLVFLFTIIEVVFVFIPESNHTQMTLASWNWHAYYHKPINNLGFRDYNDLPNEKPIEHTIFFIGDSYTEGFGIKRTEDRFSDIIASELGEDYAVFNLGTSGTALTEQIETFNNLPFYPDNIKWQFFFNDIDDICNELGYPYPSFQILEERPLVLRKLVLSSYVVNYFYFKFYPLEGMNEFITFIDDCAVDKRLRKTLLKRLSKIKIITDENGVDLYFILIPSPFDVEMCKNAYNVMESVLYELKIPNYNFSTKLKSDNKLKYSVNPWDMHINEKASNLVANHLIKQIKSKK